MNTKDEKISESQELRETDSEDEKDIDSKIHSNFNLKKRVEIWKRSFCEDS